MEGANNRHVGGLKDIRIFLTHFLWLRPKMLGGSMDFCEALKLAGAGRAVLLLGAGTFTNKSGER